MSFAVGVRVEKQVTFPTQPLDARGALSVNGGNPADAAGFYKQTRKKELKATKTNFTFEFPVFFFLAYLVWFYGFYLSCDWLWTGGGERGHRMRHREADCRRTGKRGTRDRHTSYSHSLQESLDIRKKETY